MNIKENELTREVSPLATMYLRLVTDLLTGDSKNVSIADLEFAISQITGLQAALDAKQALTTGATDFLAVFNALGQGVTSGLKRVTIADTTELDALYSGLGTVNRSPGITGTDYGVLYGVLALDDTNFGATLRTHASQLGFTSRGVFFRQNILGSWTGWRYTGGGNQNIPVTRAELAAIVAANSLSPGATYRISDHPYYMYIILTAAGGNTFEPTAQAYAARPLYRGVGVRNVDGESVNFIGCWSFIDSASIGDATWYCNRLYISLTGAVGTATDFLLDTTNWSMVDIRTGQELYAFEWHTIEYDYADDYVKVESDSLGNEFGDYVKRTPDDGFRCHMNDWDTFGFKNNKTTRWYNNSYGSCENNIGGADIYNNYGGVLNGNRFNGSVCIIARNTFLSISNSILKYEAIITDNGNITANVIIEGSDIGGEIMENATVETDRGDNETLLISDCRVGKSGDIKRCYGQIIESIIDGNIFDNNTDDSGSLLIQYSTICAGSTVENCGSVSISDSILQSQVTISGANVDIYDSDIRGSIETSGDVQLIRVELNAALGGGNDHRYMDSVVYNSATSTPTVMQTVRESKNKITGSCYVGAGQFTVANGASYSPPSIVSGCVMTVIRANGVSVDSQTTGPELTAHRTGWHRFFYNSSALCEINDLDLESIVCVNGTPVQAGYNRKTYPNYDSFINSGISVDLNLTAGDVVTMQYKHVYGSTVTFALGQINMELTYSN